MIPKNRLLAFILGGFLFSLDQILKYLARTNPTDIFVWKKILGWEYYENVGVAFNLPLPNWLVVLLTPIIIFGMIAFFLKKKNNNFLNNPGTPLIILGALSNYIDRIMFDITIDYIRIFTSVINLADVMIVAGVLLLMMESKTVKSNP
jgi:signal peptidase II